MEHFPPRIVALLQEVAAGPFEDGNGECLMKDAKAALAAIKAAQEDAERYRHVRRLSPRAFTEIHMRNIAGEGLFDDLIDQDIEMRAAAIRGNT